MIQCSAQISYEKSFRSLKNIVRMCVCKESFAFGKTREQQSRKREAAKYRALRVLNYFHNFITKSEFEFGNHVI